MMKSGKLRGGRKAWALCSTIGAAFALAFGLSLEGAGTSTNNRDRTIDSGASSSRVVARSATPKASAARSAASGASRISRVPAGQYPIAPTIVVDWAADEATQLRREGKLVGPMQFATPERGGVAGGGCSFLADCDDNNSCTRDFCDIGPGDPAGSGTCVNEPRANGDSTDCDDGVFCNGLESCSGGNPHACVGTCVGGPNNGNDCATDAANSDQCAGGICQNKECASGPNVGNACTYSEECGTPGTCAAGSAPCSGPQVCNEEHDNCQAGACVSNAGCSDGDNCTLDLCCLGGNLSLTSCAGGSNAGQLCTANLECPGSTCTTAAGTIPCPTNGVCDNSHNPCGDGADCLAKFCTNSGSQFNGLPCDSLLDCGGLGTRACSEGVLCFQGRCCDSGASCTKVFNRACANGWYAGDDGRLAAQGGAVCPSNQPCPKYTAGIGDQGTFTAVVGPTSIAPRVDIMAGSTMRKIGDDYEIVGASPYFSLEWLRFIGGVDNISNSRVSFEFYDMSGNFVEDLFFITATNELAVQKVEFTTPLTLPREGYVVAHVLQAFAAPDINSPGEFFWVATDAVDIGTNDSAMIAFDADLVGNPAMVANFIKACSGGVKHGVGCSVGGDCPGGSCSAKPGILTLELEGPDVAEGPEGACCAPGGTCSQQLSWVCKGSGSIYLGDGQDCGTCADDSANPGAPCTTDGECGGGLGDCELACALGACCNNTTGVCTLTAGAGPCTGGTFLGFGSDCDPNCCSQPLASYTGGDECSSATVNVINVPDPLSVNPEIVVTITGNNSPASSEKACNGGANDGDPCVLLSDCPGGSCDALDLCNPPSVPGSELGWFETFTIDDCAYVRIDHCCTDPVKIPSYRILYDSCPCGQTVFTKRDPNLPDEPPDSRGAPYCDTDNAWQKFGPLTPGQYWYPILSFLGGNFGEYQLHITAKACPLAACCYNECAGGVNVGQNCAVNADCPGSTCDPTCELLNILDCATRNGAYLAPPNRGTATTVCGTVCDTGSCCTGPGECVDEVAGPSPVDKADCDILGGRYVGGFRCFGGSCVGGARAGLSCQVNGDCPGSTCGGSEEDLAQPTPCPVCEIQGGDNCQLFDDSVGTRPADNTLPGGARAAEDFRPLGNTINTVCVWGQYTEGDEDGNAVDCSDDVTDNFEVVVYSVNANGLPGAVVATRTSTGANVFKAEVPNSAQFTLNQIKVFSYQLILDSAIAGLDSSGNTTYWLEIRNDTELPVDNACFWSWMAVDAVYNDYSGIGSEPGFGTGAGRTSDFAFCLDTNFNPGDSIIRACCECSGACTEKTKRDCDNAGGRWDITLADCTPNLCVSGAPGNDNCSVVVAGAATPAGDILFDNHCTSTDGPNPIPNELGSASMNSDVWYKYVAGCSGTGLFSSCSSGTANGGGIDTFIAVYHDASNPTVCPCPTSITQASLLWPVGLANDESCSGILDGGGGFLQGSVTTGNCYLVRIGGFAGQGSEEGTGTLTITCTPTSSLAPPTALDAVCFNAAVPTATPCGTNADCPVGQACRLKSRFLSINPADTAAAATPSALQVKVITVPGAPGAVNAAPYNYPAMVNDVWWVGAATNRVNDQAPYITAPLECTGAPLVQDWNAVGNIHIYGDAIVPGATYEIRSCAGVGGPCSAPLVLATARHGDTRDAYNLTNFADISALVGEFQAPNAPSSLLKSHAWITPSNMTSAMGSPFGFNQISAGVTAFSGGAPPAPTLGANQCP